MDGTSFVYRAYHALPPFQTRQGFPTQAIFGFTNMLLRILREYSPSYLGVVFDPPGPTWRHEEMREYKSQRPPTPEGLKSQLPWVKDILSAMGILHLEIDGYEADDVLATIAVKAKNFFKEIIIFTSDKDSLQLVDEKITVINPYVKNGVFSPEKVEEKFGLPPEKIPDFLALTGDPVDNIPGIPGVGEKTARKLLGEWGSVEKILENCDKIEKSLRKAIQEHREILLRNKFLIKWREVPFSIEWNKFVLGRKDRDKLKEIFNSLEFKKLLERIEEDPPSLFS